MLEEVQTINKKTTQLLKHKIQIMLSLYERNYTERLEVAILGQEVLKELSERRAFEQRPNG
jgi:hypothetical protein